MASDAAMLSNKDRNGKALQSCCCKACGLIFNTPLPAEGELRDFYRKRYRLIYKKTSHPKRRHHLRYAGWIADQIAANPHIYKRARTMLDIGSGSGEALAILSKIGLQVEGIEPTSDYAHYVTKTFNVPVFNGSIDDFHSDKTYDLIRLNHVLEHMRDPIEKLGVIRNLLSDDGVLHVEVPDVRAYFRSKSPGRIFHYGHIYNFSHETLVMTAAHAGFNKVGEFGPTSIYFQKCEPFKIVPSLDLAREFIAMNDLHQAGGYRRKTSGIGKGVRRIIAHVKEQIALRRLGSANDIIEHFARRVERLLA